MKNISAGADFYPTLHLKCRSIEVGIWDRPMCLFLCTTDRKQDTCEFCEDNNSRYTEPKPSQHYIAALQPLAYYFLEEMQMLLQIVFLSCEMGV